MALDRIRLAWFRNHRNTALVGTGAFNLLLGENGAGKTNILEAISLFAPGRGLRRAALPDMAGQGGDGAFAVAADLTQPNADPLRIGTGTSPDKPGRRILRVGGADTPAVQLGEHLSIFWLTPAMDRLFMDSPSARRRFLDRMVLALEPGHARASARLERALTERNRLLGAPSLPDAQWLTAIETQLAEAGAQVAAARARTIEALGETLACLPDAPPQNLFARPLLAYASGGPITQAALTQALAQSRPRDRAAGRTLIGPHRDDMLVTMAAKNQPAAECSTGEQKAMLIALTLAHCELAGRVAQVPRLLLLDEVAAHLDPLRRAALFDRLAANGAQVWMTGTEPEPFEALDRPSVWQVVEGGIEERG
ncbi:MAG: DNA replication/repair protein RecF [Sphingomonadales bacterium]|nr:DNA replication/repair protein RecF [Sphingomonadales bacterium]MDE2172249.1 DNA replication/repair protein RecF [Sphingomonadales bacterium]